MNATADTRETYLAQFDRFDAGLNGRRRGPLHAMRRAAIERFAELGFPTTRHEEWRFTSVAPLARRTFQPADGNAAAAGAVVALREELGVGASAGVLVWVNGRYAPELSRTVALPAGAWVGSLAEALAAAPALVEPHMGRYARFDEQPFTALNT